MGNNLNDESSGDESGPPGALSDLRPVHSPRPQYSPTLIDQSDEEFNEAYNNEINEPIAGFVYHENRFDEQGHFDEEHQYAYDDEVMFENPDGFEGPSAVPEGLGGEGK